MFFIIGLEKEADIFGEACIAGCFSCKKRVPWEIGTVTDWISFFSIKAIPFYARFYLICSNCGDSITLSAQQYYYIKNQMIKNLPLQTASPLYQEIMLKIEKVQLAGKNATQINFIRSSIE